jgi:hypothetical protein
MKKFYFIITGLALLLFCPFVYGANKVVVIPLNSTQKPGSPDKVWGEGRPGTATVTHDDPNGYCTTSEGINFALSTHFATWGAAASVCPMDTWVCTADEISSTICNIIPQKTYNTENCDGILNPSDASQTLTSLKGWLADAYVAVPLLPLFMRFKFSDQLSDLQADYCTAMRVWCCWE